MDPYSKIMSILKHRRGAMILVGFLFASCSFFFLVISEKNFKASTDFLVIQNANATQDVYSLSKSAEYLGNIFSESVTSELFIKEVMNTGKVNQDFLPFNKKEKLKKWSEIVRVSQNENLGIINLNVFDNSQKQVLAISEGIGLVLTQKNNLFRGENQNIEVIILSGPVLEKNPSTKAITLAIVGGFFFGGMMSLVYMFYNENLIVHSRKSFLLKGNIIGSSKEELLDEEYLESLKAIDG